MFGKVKLPTQPVHGSALIVEKKLKQDEGQDLWTQLVRRSYWNLRKIPHFELVLIQAKCVIWANLVCFQQVGSIST